MVMLRRKVFEMPLQWWRLEEKLGIELLPQWWKMTVVLLAKINVRIKLRLFLKLIAFLYVSFPY